MGGNYSKLMDEVNEVTAVIKDTVSYMQKGVEDLAGVRAMKEALIQVTTVCDQLDEEETEALEKLNTASSQVGLTVHFARVAVLTCKSIVKTIHRIMTAEQGDMSEKINLAIHVYVMRTKELIKDLKKAGKEFAKTIDGLKKAMEGIESLKILCEGRIYAIEGKAESENIYCSGSATRVAMWMAVVNWWNPVGWLLAPVVIGGAATVAVGVAAEVTEGDLRKEYGRGIKALIEAIQSFEKVSENIEENVCELEKKAKQLEEVCAQQRAIIGEMSITYNVDGLMFNIFKEDVFNLDQLCDDYLNAPVHI